MRASKESKFHDLESHKQKASTFDRSNLKRYKHETDRHRAVGNQAVTAFSQGNEKARTSRGLDHQETRLLNVFEEGTHDHQSSKGRIAGFLARAKSIVKSLLLQSRGQPLDPETLSLMEARFHDDFSEVRVHTDGAAQTGAEKIGAKAFTSGNHIWFGRNKGPKNIKLLSHELTHVVQQRTGKAGILRSDEDNLATRDFLEAEANVASNVTAQISSKQSSEGDSLSSLSSDSRSSSSPAVIQFDFEEDVLQELRRMPSAEAEDISEQEREGRRVALYERRRRLNELFNNISSREEAASLHERLSTRRRGDRLSERFHDILATPTRQELLGILRGKIQAEEEGGRAQEGPSLGEAVGISETVDIEGDPANHPDYIDNAFEAAGLEALGGRFLLYQRVENGRGVDGIPLQRDVVHLQDDPLSGVVGSLNLVYSSRSAAQAALSGVGRENIYTYYLENGLIYPTTISETTVPRTIYALRRIREWERRQARAMRDLSLNLLLWYVGARLPVRTRPSRPAATRGAETTRGAAAVTTGEIVGPLGRLTQAEIQQAITASGGRTVELYTKLTQVPTSGRAISFATERALAEAARSQGQVFVVRVPDILFRRLEMIGVLQRSQTLMGGTVGTEIRALPQVSELILRFLVP